MLTFVVPKRGNPPWAQYTEPFQHAYCERHGYRLVLVNDPQDGRHPSWLKCLAHRYALGESLWVGCDLDVMPMPWAPPLYEALACDRLNIARDPVLPSLAEHGREKGFDPACLIYNGGLFAYPAQLVDWMEGIYRRRDPAREAWYEQANLNEQIALDGLPVHELDRRWNWFPRPDDLESVWFLHLAGLDASAREMAAREVYGRVA